MVEVTRKQGTPNFRKIEHFLPPDTHTYVCVSRGKKCSLLGKFSVVSFLVKPILRCAFCLIADVLLFISKMKAVEVNISVIHLFFRQGIGEI